LIKEVLGFSILHANKKDTVGEFVKKLDKYFDDIKETFNNPLEIKWIDNGSLIGLFTINENIYKINCSNYGNNIWKYSFYLYNEIENTFTTKSNNNENDKFRVLSTVKSGLEYLIKNKVVDSIIFGSVDSSRGRKKLYESVCVEFSKINNYIFYTKNFEDKQLFILYKDWIDKEILFSTLTKIIEDEK